MNEKISIRKLQGEDGYKTFSIRIKEEVAAKLSNLANESNRSRNDIVNILLEYAIDHCEIVEK